MGLHGLSLLFRTKILYQYSDDQHLLSSNAITFQEPQYSPSLQVQPDKMSSSNTTNGHCGTIPARVQRAMLAQHRRDVNSNLACIGAVFPDQDNWQGRDEVDIAFDEMVIEEI